jgi:hypothetical protein
VDVVDLMVEHDGWLSRRLLDSAAVLPDEALDEPVLVTPPSIGAGGPAATLRAMLASLIETKELCTASINGRAYRPLPSTSLQGMRARLEEANASFAQLVREIGKRNAWNTVFIDAVHEPPQTESIGAAVAHVLDRDAVCCELIAEELIARGVESVSLDGIGWKQARHADRGQPALSAARRGFQSRPERGGDGQARTEFDARVEEISRRLEEARRALETGSDSKAARILGDLVYRTHDRDLLTQIHELGVRGRERAGRLHGVTWRDIVKESEARLARPEIV